MDKVLEKLEGCGSPSSNHTTRYAMFMTYQFLEVYNFLNSDSLTAPLVIQDGERWRQIISWQSHVCWLLTIWGKVLEVLNDISADSGVGKHQATTICQDGEEKLFLKGKLICKIHRTKQRELEKFNLQSFFYYYFSSNMTKEIQFQCC